MRMDDGNSLRIGNGGWVVATNQVAPNRRHNDLNNDIRVGGEERRWLHGSPVPNLGAGRGGNALCILQAARQRIAPDILPEMPARCEQAGATTWLTDLRRYTQAYIARVLNGVRRVRRSGGKLPCGYTNAAAVPRATMKSIYLNSPPNLPAQGRSLIVTQQVWGSRIASCNIPIGQLVSARSSAAGVLKRGREQRHE